MRRSSTIRGGDTDWVASTAMSAQERSLDDVKRDVAPTRRPGVNLLFDEPCVPTKSRGFWPR